jgi:hypothetical protein
MAACSPQSDGLLSKPPAKPLPLPVIGAAAPGASVTVPDLGRSVADMWRESNSNGEWALAPPNRPPASSLISYY